MMVSERRAFSSAGGASARHEQIIGTDLGRLLVAVQTGGARLASCDAGAVADRLHYSNLDLLPGILRVLRSGCRWRDPDHPGSPSGVAHWHRLR